MKPLLVAVCRASPAAAAVAVVVVMARTSEAHDDPRVRDPRAVPADGVPRATHPNSVAIRAGTPRRDVPRPAVGWGVQVGVRDAVIVDRFRVGRHPHPTVAVGVHPTTSGVFVRPLRGVGWRVLSGSRARRRRTRWRGRSRRGCDVGWRRRRRCRRSRGGCRQRSRLCVCRSCARRRRRWCVRRLIFDAKRRCLWLRLRFIGRGAAGQREHGKGCSNQQIAFHVPNLDPALKNAILPQVRAFTVAHDTRVT